MNTDEAFAICRMAKGAFPATNMDEFTPEAWSLALEDDRFVDAREALKQLMREQPFIHVSEIVGRISKIRRDRILAYGVIEPPASLDPADTAAYNEWYVRTVKAIGDGDMVNPIPELRTGPRGPWDEEQDRATAEARMKEIRAELAKREPAAVRTAIAPAPRSWGRGAGGTEPNEEIEHG